jgi:hypothetical protein
MRAAVSALKSAANTVTQQHLEKTALSISQCEKILAQAREGESRLTENEESRLHFRKALGLQPKATGRESSPAPTDAKFAKTGEEKASGTTQPNP